jgi:uncharacterized membrane protein YfcA
VTFAQALAVFAGGIAAGTINTVVGSGTLITFPILLGVGYSPVTANVSNTIGLVPGSVSGAWGYRRELAGQRDRALRFGAASLLGGATGAVLLLVLPPAAFKAIVPAFIAIAVVAVLVQPNVERRPGREHGAAGLILVLVGGIYGGYFGAAQGILLLAVLGFALDEDLHRINALKNVLAGIVNGVAALIFIVAADVAWGPVALIAAGSVLGGQLGARYGRRLPARALRALIAVVGVAAIVQLLA